MTPARFNAACKAMAHTTYVCQWGGSHVWKIGGKVFAIGSSEAGGAFHVTFKCSALAFEVLKDAPGCRPAPHLASRGMIWIQRTGPGVLDDKALAEHLAASYRLVADGLTRAKRRELGFDAAPPPAERPAKRPAGKAAKAKPGPSSATSEPKSPRTAPAGAPAMSARTSRRR